jgi:hypothetical protein
LRTNDAAACEARLETRPEVGDAISLEDSETRRLPILREADELHPSDLREWWCRRL